MSLLRAEAVTRVFSPRRWSGAAPLVAVDGVSLGVEPGETVALVGESGSGKTTLGRMLAGLDRPDRGRVLLDGAPLPLPEDPGGRALRRRIQYVAQNPLAALNPRATLLAQVAEAARVHRIAATPAAAREAARAELAAVGIDAETAARLPREVSGGQRQRAVIARALVLGPSVLVLDEPVSALDLSVQAQVLGLIRSLQARGGLTLVFISHDLRVVHYLADRIAVMQRGRIVEEGPSDAVFFRPGAPYTRALLAALPRVERHLPGAA